MIRVNSINNVNYVTKPAFKSEKQSKECIPADTSLNGAQALAAYNMSFIKPEKYVLDPIKPVDLDNIEGEKIYTPEGKLYSIINEDENTKTVYTPYEDNENFIESVITTDKKTGNVILKQYNDIDDGKYSNIYITEYSPENGNELRYTNYENGELAYTTKTEYGEDGEETTLEYSAWNKTFSIRKHKDESYKEAIFDEDKLLKRINLNKRVKNKKVETEAEFYNGGIYKLSKREEIIIPNMLGREKLNNSELKPSEKFSSDIDFETAEGEKTFYSNGALASIENDEYSAKLNPDGSLLEFKTHDKTVSFENGVQIIEEKIGENKTKTTIYYKNDSVGVNLEDNDKYEEVTFNQKHKPSSYEEGIVKEDGEQEQKLSLYFTKHGMLEDAYNW